MVLLSTGSSPTELHTMAFLSGVRREQEHEPPLLDQTKGGPSSPPSVSLREHLYPGALPLAFGGFLH